MEKPFLMMLSLAAVCNAQAASLAFGAAPQGDAKVVAKRIITDNFPTCKRVTSASRLSDGSISASCDGINYRVFTIFNAKEGKLMEIAMNCNTAKQMGVDCY